MKILAISDIHGAYDIAEAIIRKENADVIVLGGDLTNYGKVAEVEKAIGQFRKNGERMVTIAGNLDRPEHDDLYVKLGLSVNGRGIIVGDVGFFGVSAAPHSRLHTPYEISEELIAETIRAGYEAVKSCRYKVLVSHAPPFGTRVDIIHSGYHVGSTAVRDFIEGAQPLLVLCGHIHEGRGQDMIEKTKIVNCGHGRDGQYALIEIGENGDISTHMKELSLQ